MSQQTILIVGGAWHTADYLQPLAQSLQDAGYKTVTVGLPSVGADPPAKDFFGDVAAIRNVAQTEISNGKDILAVLHSLSGICGSEALRGLGKEPNSSDAGVVAIAYIACQLPKKGNNFDDHLEACGDHTWKLARQAFTQNGLLELPPDFAQSMFYHDLSDETQAKKWTSLLKPQSVGVYDSSLSFETYKELPCRYLATKFDQAFKHEYQVKTLVMAGFPKDRVVTIETGHTPWLTKPDQVKKFILETAAIV